MWMTGEEMTLSQYLCVFHSLVPAQWGGQFCAHGCLKRRTARWEPGGPAGNSPNTTTSQPPPSPSLHKDHPSNQTIITYHTDTQLSASHTYKTTNGHRRFCNLMWRAKIASSSNYRWIIMCKLLVQLCYLSADVFWVKFWVCMFILHLVHYIVH